VFYEKRHFIRKKLLSKEIGIEIIGSNNKLGDLLSIPLRRTQIKFIYSKLYA